MQCKAYVLHECVLFSTGFRRIFCEACAARAAGAPFLRGASRPTANKMTLGSRPRPLRALVIRADAEAEAAVGRSLGVEGHVGLGAGFHFGAHGDRLVVVVIEEDAARDCFGGGGWCVDGDRL